MSFVNPGDVDQAGVPLADPCLSTSCGPHGRCVAVNMTPTCTCDRGYVAVSSATGVQCNAPASPIPPDFYQRAMPTPAHPGRSMDAPPSKRPTAQGCACATPDATAPWMLGLSLAALVMARRRNAA
jgi:MYXO-CTERM domain-containing protein